MPTATEEKPTTPKPTERESPKRETPPPGSRRDVLRRFTGDEDTRQVRPVPARRQQGA